MAFDPLTFFGTGSAGIAFYGFIKYGVAAFLKSKGRERTIIVTPPEAKPTNGSAGQQTREYWILEFEKLISSGNAAQAKLFSEASAALVEQVLENQNENTKKIVDAIRRLPHRIIHKRRR